jgi:predicted dehydrogenase
MVKKVERERVRYAVVGAGNIAQVAVLPAFAHANENSELAVIASDDPEKRAALGKRYGVPTVPYADLEGAIAREDVDALYVTLPNSLHRAFVERAARAGVHALCEKPMATTSDDCRAMIDACDRAGLRLMIAYRLHFEEANVRAIETVRSGRLGDPRYFSASFSQQVRDGDIRTRPDLGGGALFDMGIYCINAARFLFGDEPSAVVAFQAHGNDARFKEVDEMTSGLMHFADDRLAHFVAAQGAAAVDSMRIVGTRGELRVEPAFGYTTELKHYLTIGSKTQETTFEKCDQFAPELVHFSSCLRTGVEPEPSGREGLADVRIMEALVASSHTGKLIALSPFDAGERPDARLLMKKPAARPPSPVRAPSPGR